MASDQCTGAEITIYAVSPAGLRTPIYKGVNEQSGPGGSPDGVQATTSANQLPRINLSNVVVPGGFKIIPTVKLKVTDGVDISDCVFNVPFTDQNGNIKTLTITDLGMTADLPAASPIGIELDLGSGYELSNNEALRIGGSDGSQGQTSFMSVENDTA